MSNPDKKIIIDGLLERVNASPFLIVVDYTGLTVTQFTELRTRLGAAGANAVVAKNSYVKKALAEAGMPDIAEGLVGQTAFITGSSEVFAAAKVVKNFEKEFKKPEFKIGILDGAILTADKLKSIADIPSREAVLSQLLGLINEPATRIARVLNAKFNPDGGSEATEEEAPAAAEASAETAPAAEAEAAPAAEAAAE